MSKLEDIKNIIDVNLESLDISKETKDKIINGSKGIKTRRQYKFLRVKYFSVPAAAVILIFVLLFTNLFGIFPKSLVKAQDLMKGIQPQEVEATALSDEYIRSQADFSIDLFKKSFKDNTNTLISPLSAYLALSMTANGAEGNTLKELESVLGKYNINISDINKFNSSYIKNLSNFKSGELKIADSIWFRNDFDVSKAFLQNNANFYKASAYKTDFSSKQTTNDIINWVKANTNGLIDNVPGTIDPNTLMYLLNTVYFNAQWKNIYTNEQVRDSRFLTESGEITTPFMYSSEYMYISDNTSQGFIKSYNFDVQLKSNKDVKDRRFSFVAILPNEGVSLDSYVNLMTGDKFLALIKDQKNEEVQAAIPKFKTEYSTSLVDSLKALGLHDCFSSSANFNNMSDSGKNNLFISGVDHKTFIQVDEQGTKAGAATSVTMLGAGPPEIKHNVILCRPFIYAIIDNETNLPVFIGTMFDPSK